MKFSTSKIIGRIQSSVLKSQRGVYILYQVFFKGYIIFVGTKETTKSKIFTLVKLQLNLDMISSTPNLMNHDFIQIRSHVAAFCH